MNKQSPEYIRVREEIAKKRCEPCLFRSQYRGCIAHTDIKNCETSQTFADSILAIKGIGIIADNQDLPQAKFYKDWGGESGKAGYKFAQSEMLKANFKRLVE